MTRRTCATAIGLTAAAATAVALAPVSGAIAGTEPTGPTGPVVVGGAAQPVFSERRADWIVREAWVEVPVDSDRDGVRDRVHIRYARAAAATDRLPVVMEASPYFGGFVDIANHNVDHDLYDPTRATRVRPGAGSQARAGRLALLDQWTSPNWISRGFAWVEVESLGTGGSTGCPSAGGVNETLGPKAVIDWLNGRATAYDRAGARVRADFANGRVGMLGHSYDGSLANAVATTGVDGLKAIIPMSAISDWYGYYRAGGAVVAPWAYQGEDADVMAKVVLTRRNPATCAPQIAELARSQDRRTGDMSAFWAERSYLAQVAKVKAAVYVSHGLADWNVKPSQAARWYRALRAQGTPAKIYLHPDGHIGQPPLYEQNRWFTRYVIGAPSNVDNEPRALLGDNRGNIRRFADWPNPKAGVQSIPLSRLTLRAGTPGPRLTFSDNPANSLRPFTVNPVRAEGLAFASAPLTRPTRLSGFATMRLRAAFGQVNANVSIGILDLNPQGLAALVTQGWTDPQNRSSLWRTEALQPGRFERLTVDLEATEYVFAPGHRVAVTILQSDYWFTIRPPAGKTMTVDTEATILDLPLNAPLP